jgi:pimeloyl-ACP methyl ester carboxylesterase
MIRSNDGSRRLRCLGVLLIAAGLGLVAIGCAQATTKPPATSAATPPAAATAPPSAAAAGAPASGTQKPADRAKPPMATSSDGTVIAYEVAGSGPPLLLVHGAGESRRSWQERGYLEPLQKQFTVITMDRRGTGDSGKPVGVDAYALASVLGDVLAVADAAGAKRFHVWGFGDGAVLARHLAVQSDRVMAAVVVGASLGPAVTGVAKDAITAMRAKWRPLVEAQTAGTLDEKSLTQSDRTAWESGIAISALSLGALLDYPPVDPADFKAPTLWVVGGADDSLTANVKEYEGKLTGTMVTLKLLTSASYSDCFIRSDLVIPEVVPFLLKAAPSSHD